LGERRLCSGTAPSNKATALPSLLIPVTTLWTCGDAACCWPAAYPAAINATAAIDNPTIRFISSPPWLMFSAPVCLAQGVPGASPLGNKVYLAAGRPVIAPTGCRAWLVLTCPGSPRLYSGAG